MSNSINSLGLMSGTSGDGVDASIINSDGKGQFKVLINKYFQYTNDISENIYKLKRKINKVEDIKKYVSESLTSDICQQRPNHLVKCTL